MKIHSTAIISKKAQLSEDVEIGPYSIVEDDVKIGCGVKILSHAHILNHTSIGDFCQVHMGAVLGHLPQIRKDCPSNGRLIIGKGNVFREYVTVHRSSFPESATIIGDDNYFMGFSHIAHDCNIGSHVTVCNGALVAGHVNIGDYSFISGNVTIHQFCRIGKLSMIGGLARVSKDVPPYMLLKGDSLVWAINSVGLRRAGFSVETRIQIKKAFKVLYRSGLNVQQAVDKIKASGSSEAVAYLINFIEQSSRGICAYKQPSVLDCLSNTGIFFRTRTSYQLFSKNSPSYGKF